MSTVATKSMEGALIRLQRVKGDEYEKAHYACYVNAENDDPADSFDAEWLRGRGLALSLWRSTVGIA